MKENKLRQYEKERLLIEELSSEISSILELNKLLPKIMDAFVEAAQVSKGSIMLLNEEGVLEIKASVGLSERAIRESHPKLGEGIAGKVALTGKPILINDTTKDSLYKDFVLDPEKERPAETLLCLPLIFKNRVLGVANLENKIDHQPFLRNDKVLLSILANQSAVAIANTQLYNSSITDGLTGLYNQKYFRLSLTQEIERTRRYKCSFSLLLLDIDYFKKINDTYGHQTGDYVLSELAKLLKSSVRASDLCARYGGEEFVVIFLESDPADTFWIGERLRKKIERAPFTEKRLVVTVSIGMVSYQGEKNIDNEDLIKSADTALYQSKNNGRNRVTLYPLLDTNLQYNVAAQFIERT